MNYPTHSYRRFLPPAFAAVFLLTAALARAQAAANPAPAPAKDETIKLNAFEVRSETDRSYGALDSNSLAAFRMELAKVPATAEVFTSAFMDDLGLTSIEDVLT